MTDPANTPATADDAAGADELSADALEAVAGGTTNDYHPRLPGSYLIDLILWATQSGGSSANGGSQ